MTLSYTSSMFNEFIGKYFNEKSWVSFSETIIKIILVLILSKVIIKIANKMIRKVFLIRAKSPLRTNERREATLYKLLENVTYVCDLLYISYDDSRILRNSD